MPPRQPNPLPELGDLERAVLELLWQRGELDVQEAHRAVGAPRGISLNTVGSALERLYRKQLVTRTKISHAYRYQAACEREEFVARQILAAAGGSKKLASTGLLASFIDVVTEADRNALDELERLIASKRKEWK
ncbi:MAG TPA: BlaI/MecI/CopY family transcriptional regulator [Bryobacteraceae bacterium]|nr:BlaI/MecI/CopY family transcriptional regulator [Bryobacteraceae bacterium]